MLSFNSTTQNTSILALLANAPKEAKARSKQSGLNLLNAKQPQTGAQAIMASLRARGVDVHRLDAKAKETIRQRGAVIDKVAGGNIKTIDDIKNLTVHDDGLQVSGIKDLKDDKGQSLRGAATTDGKILLNKNLENKTAALKATAIEEIGERTFQDIAKTQTNANKRLPTATKEGLSQGDFGAEVAKRVTAGGTEADFKKLRSNNQNDTTTINGKTAEAGLADKLKEQTKINKTKKTKSTNRQNNNNLNDLYHSAMNPNVDVQGLTHQTYAAAPEGVIPRRRPENHVFAFEFEGNAYAVVGDNTTTRNYIAAQTRLIQSYLYFTRRMRTEWKKNSGRVIKFHFTNLKVFIPPPHGHVLGFTINYPNVTHVVVGVGPSGENTDTRVRETIFHEMVHAATDIQHVGGARREDDTGPFYETMDRMFLNYDRIRSVNLWENPIAEDPSYRVLALGVYTPPSQNDGAGPSGTPPPENNTITPPRGYENCREVDAPGGFFLPIRCDKKK